ncbi:tetrathionate reductase subunit A [Shewanella glacialipiscicola]|uniref:Tetrathionate reductase subunit A n=1 Tax=Shewanella glacialipiscicola TaxID=614069 RepID=A0ABQ6J1L0_9GAMM|nr:tetrathionate reductase subunit A [Shewanella glacialipiscicola]MCL1087517.1 tetrathionate reductase subunit TtrA [Shewanella glacialipiscicola]GIU09599.1 tetrathionate reductase subunit A [Shewanella glacialipiscicola]GMA80755.1 tetrathionate reductase subunit A [Shewanella glacialipiscicola]
MDKSKRRFIKGAAVTGGVGLFAAGYSHTLTQIGKGVVNGTSGKPTHDPLHGNSLTPEYKVDLKTGQLISNDEQRVVNTMCLGCWTKCGVRARIDQKTDKIIRISGNPYHPLSAREHIDFDTPIKAAFVGLSAFQEQGLQGRSTACARGNAMLEQLDSPHRVTQCLKRVGKRGSGQWQSISFEQLLNETVEGGDLFGEGHVEGLRAIRDVSTPLDANNPEYGPKANQLLVSNASDEGRDALIKRFTFNSFGTRNFANHGAYCGFTYRAGAGALLDDLKKYAHLKPDWDNSEFLLFIGTSPQQSGNPFKRQARQLANARVNNTNFSYVVVSPMLPNTSNQPCAGNNTWLPIRPATDSALAMGMLRWIIEQQRYAVNFLTAPNVEAAKAAGYRGFSNASYLIVSDPTLPRFGQYLFASDLGLPFEGKAYGEQDSPLVIDEASGAVTLASMSQKAKLAVIHSVDTPKGIIAVKSSFQLLSDAALGFSMAEYAKECDISEAKIIDLADKFTSHGTKAAVISHGGTMSANGFYSAWAIMMLNAMIGNINLKGGALASGGSFPAFGKGPRYNLQEFDGMLEPKGVFLSRSKFPYEKTSEYRRKVEAGQSPYPSKEPWYPISSPLLGEHLTAAVHGYPYTLKAWINHMGNPVYGQAGLGEAIGEQLKDPKVLPLFISIDSFINETSALSDYIVPDTLTYESWGWTSAWQGTMTKVVTGRWPIVEPRVAKTATGDVVCMESFLSQVAIKLALPGFGEDAITAADGSLHPLTRAADYSLYGAANVAYLGTAVADINAEDMYLSGVSRIQAELNTRLKPEEVKKVSYLFARGGRFENMRNARDEAGNPSKVWPKPMMLWNPEVGSRRNSLTGEFMSGCPRLYQPALADGTPLDKAFDKSQWPLLISSYKSHTMSSMSIGSDRLRQVHPNNPVRLNEKTAARFGISTGDTVKISTPNGSVIALVECVAGVQADCIAIEHGYGHKELGARDTVIDDISIAANPLIRVGINMNDLNLFDPSRNGRYPLVDWASGASARQGLPAKIEKIA